MRIRAFCKFVEMNELEPVSLRDAVVVVDGLSFFYDSYKNSKLQHRYGCEADRYADYLREHLSIFKKANVKCHFVFKGGHENMQKRLEKPRDPDTVTPIFFKNVFTEVLNEMGFDYVTCLFESKKEAIALAQKLQCPIISYNVEFCFSGLQYIPRNELKFNNETEAIDCQSFTFEKFLHKYRLTAEKIALFIVLTDENIFPPNKFRTLFERLRLPNSYYHRIPKLLKRLSAKDRDDFLGSILESIPVTDRERFLEEECRVRQLIQRQESCGLAAEFCLERAVGAVGRSDALWFLKGVMAGHVAVNYVNLYRSNIFFGSDVLRPTTSQDDPMLLSLSIVRYAYDLLTNFQKDGFIFYYDNEDLGRESFFVDVSYSTPEPDYEADVCVFENGWSELRQLGLLRHFMWMTLQRVDLHKLEELPEDARLLVAALVYFSRMKAADTSAEAACVLLSYVTLGVVADKANEDDHSQSIVDSSADRNAVSAADCSVAAAIMADYRTVSDDVAEEIFDRELLYPLVEFQHCLSELIAVNALCGAEWASPRISRVYNGTLVYRLRHAMRASGSDRLQFVDELLSPAPTVYAFFNGLLDTYEEILLIH